MTGLPNRCANARTILPMTDAREDRIEGCARDGLPAPPFEKVDVAVIRVRDLGREVRKVSDLLEELGLECPRKCLTRHEIVPHEKLVFTDAFTSAWEPSAKPFMTGILTFEDAGNGRTNYTARVRHWTVADREAHEKMGFHEGWGIATNQLEALAKTL